MKISFIEPNRFVASCTFSEKEIVKDAGFFFDFNYTKKWYTHNYATASALVKHFDVSAKNKIKQVSIEAISWGRGIPKIPKDKKLDAHQLRAVKFCTTRNHSYLAFDAGLGKTPISVALINEVVHENRALIIVPPFLVSNWVREIKEWQTEDYKIQVVSSGAEFELLPRTDILIVPDSLIARDNVSRSLYKHRFGIIIVDEVQRFLNASSLRTKSLYGSADNSALVALADKRVFLSGTPIRRGPMDLYPVLKSNAWDSIEYLSHHHYGVRYCAAYRKNIGRGNFAWDYSGSCNLTELKDKIYSKFILRETLTDNLTDLKDKLIERVVTLDDKDKKTITKIEKTIFKDQALDEIIGSKDLGAIAEYRSALIKPLVRVSTEYIKNILEGSSDSLLVYAIHQDTIKNLEKSLKEYNPQSIYGPVKKTQRDAIEKDFQDKKIRVLIANINCMVGLNLTAGSRIVFVESSWDYTDNSQAISRAYRRGQNNIVIADHLVLAGTISEYVLRTVLKKKRTINKLI